MRLSFRRSLPPTKPSSDSPPVLTPRQRNLIHSPPPPQSPGTFIVSPPLGISPKAEEKQTHSPCPPAKMTKNLPVFSESTTIGVIDIPSKLIQCESITSEEQALGEIFSPPVPFQKPLKRATPLAKKETKSPEDEELQMAKSEPKVQKDIEKFESFDFKKPELIPQTTNENEDKIKTMFENTLRVVFVCYLVGIAFFFRMFNNAFNVQGIVSNAPVAVVGGVDMLAPGLRDTERKERFDFVREMKQNVALLGDFSMYQDFVSLLPLSSVKQLLSGREHAFATIHAELEAIDDNVLI
jgi:hypothetical protein